jgi:two-component system sensor histidine kinase CpxA
LRIRNSLYLQIFAALFLYLSSLAILGFIAFNAQFGIGWEALFNSFAGDRVETIAEGIGNQLRTSDQTNWNQILKNFQHIYGSQFYIFGLDGEQIAGEKVTVPSALKSRIIGPRPILIQARRMSGEGMIFLGAGRRYVYGFGADSPHAVRGGGYQPNTAYATTPMGQFFGPPPSPPPAFGVLPSRSSINSHSVLDVPPPMALQMERIGPPPPLMLHHDRFSVHTENPDRFWFVVRLPLEYGDFPHPVPVSLIASPDNIWQSSLLFDFKFVLEATGVAVVLSLLFWCPLVYGITRSLSEVTAATERIAEGKFDTRIKNNRRDEIGRLSGAVNTMAGRLDDFVTGQRRFLGDISHELYTPIARLHMALELLASHLGSQHKDLVQDIREEVIEMTNLVNELLAFSKAGIKGQDIQLTSVNLKEIFDRLITRLDLQDKAEVHVADNLNVLGDPLLLDRSFANILRNSVRYAIDRGPISIRAQRIELGQTRILIDDNGPGVSDEALNHLGQPFFRPESDRARDSGGAGLGLAIVRTCIETCQGKVYFRNRQTGGFEVEIRLVSSVPAKRETLPEQIEEQNDAAKSESRLPVNVSSPAKNQD